MLNACAFWVGSSLVLEDDIRCIIVASFEIRHKLFMTVLKRSACTVSSAVLRARVFYMAAFGTAVRFRSVRAGLGEPLVRFIPFSADLMF